MTTLSLQAISRDEALVQNVLLGTARDLEFRVGSTLYGLKFYKPEFSPEPALEFSVQVGEHLLGVELEAVPKLSFNGTSFPSAEYELMPAEVAKVVFEAFLAPYLGALGIFFNTEVQLQAVGDCPKGQGGSYGITISQNGTPAWARGRVHAPNALWGSVAHKLQSQAAFPSEDYSEVPLFARLQIGASRVPFEKLQELELQDILLFDRGIRPDSGQCVVHVGDRLSFNAELKDNTITLQSVMKESTPSENLPPSAVAGAKPSLDAFSVHLTFEVGEREIPLGELQALQAGYTFEMPSPLDCPVSIKANGSKIGTGELVQVADRLGVRVVDFSQERPARDLPPPRPVSAAQPQPEVDDFAEEELSVESEEDSFEDDTRDA